MTINLFIRYTNMYIYHVPYTHPDWYIVAKMPFITFNVNLCLTRAECRNTHGEFTHIFSHLLHELNGIKLLSHVRVTMRVLMCLFWFLIMLILTELFRKIYGRSVDLCYHSLPTRITLFLTETYPTYGWCYKFCIWRDICIHCSDDWWNISWNSNDVRV